MGKIGIIKRFDELKGFGFVVSANNEKFFLHKTNFVGSVSDLNVGKVVYFEPGEKRDKRAPLAKKCRFPALGDIQSALLLVGTKREFTFERTFKGESRWGNPYVRKDKSTYDILDHFFRSVVQDIKFSDFLDFICNNWGNYVSSWDDNEISDLIIVLSKSIKRINFQGEKRPENKQQDDWIAEIFGSSDMDMDHYRLNHSDMVNKLADKVKQYFSDEQIYKIWRRNDVPGFKDATRPERISNNKQLPFSEKLLIKHDWQAQPQVFRRLKYYSLTPKILSEITKQIRAAGIITDIDSRIQNDEQLKAELEYCNLLTDSEKKDHYKTIIDRLDAHLHLYIWGHSKYDIDPDVGSISEPKSRITYINNYLLPENIVLEGAETIDEVIAKKLSSFGEKGDALLAKALLSIADTSRFLEDKLEDFIISVQVLNKHNQLHVVQSIVPYLTNYSWEFFIDKGWIDWRDEGLTLLSHNISIGADQKVLLANVIFAKYFDNQDLFSRKLDRIFNLLIYLSPDIYSEFFTEAAKHLSNHEIATLLRNVDLSDNQIDTLLREVDFAQKQSSFNILALLAETKYSGLNKFLRVKKDFILKYSDLQKSRLFAIESVGYIKDHLISNGDFTSILLLENLLPKCTDSERLVIKEKLDKRDMSLRTYSAVVSTFLDLQIPMFPSRYESFLKEKCDPDDLIEAARVCGQLPEKDQEKLAPLFEIFDYSVFNQVGKIQVILNNCLTSSMQKAVIESTESSNTLQVIFNYLSQEISANILTPHDLKSVLKFGVELNPEISFQFAIKLNREYKEYAVNLINLTSDNYQNIIDLIEINFDHLNELTLASESSLAILLQSLSVKSEKTATEGYNKFNLLTECAYQTVLYLLILKLVHNDQVPKWHENIILHKIAPKQLGIKLVQKFISSHQLANDDLMRQLNTTLKDHFKMLDVDTIGHDEFNNIFSIEHLVKKCNGRKTVRGLKHWKGGQFERYYTDGNHGLAVTEVGPNIYCEGRFWKNLEIWSSRTNKPIRESQSLYWCRGKSCAGVNTTPNLELTPSSWTLSEISEIKSIEVDRLFFTNVAGWLNRMKTIFDRLHCDECQSILRPLTFVPHKLGFYAVPMFQCVNQGCGLFEMKIRFTHCRGCKKILDSRECETCSNCNWLECDDSECGACGCGANHNDVYAQY